MKKSTNQDKARACFPPPGVLAILVSLLTLPAAQAFELNTDNSDVKLRWDNTVKYSAGYRVGQRSPALANDQAQGGNQGDGDSNFGRGLISNRVDLLSEFDFTYQNFGARVSGAAWYDSVYNSATHNNAAPSMYNASSVSSNQFPDATRKLHGEKAELLDAFLFAKGSLGDTTETVRLGRHAQVWGETIFFGNNGIAGAMAPVDVIKLLSVPGTQFKEIIRPVGQLSGQVQLKPNLALGAYYQYQWDKTWLPGVGSYFSGADFLDTGGEQLFSGPGAANARVGDLEAKNSGQGGLQVRWTPEGSSVDLGFYALRYHDKTPNLIISPLTSTYRLAYQENIKTFGASASTTIGNANVAIEASVRHDTPLANAGTADLYGLVPVSAGGPSAPANNSNNPSYPLGRTAHINLSTLYQVPVLPFAAESTLLAELAWNRTTSITKNPTALDPNADRDAWGTRMVYEPTYRQALQGMDISVPIGLSYFPKGRSSAVGAFGPNKGGDMSIGVSGVYLETWYVSLNYTHFYGPEGTIAVLNGPAVVYSYNQNLKDRDFVSFSLRRTF